MKQAFVFRFSSLSFTFNVNDSNIPSSPLKSSIVALYIVFMFSCFSILSKRIGSPFNFSLLQIIVTLLQIFDKYRDSSRALLPDPTIETSCPLYRLPSHKEQ